jgi:hypothetical protein
MIKFFYAFVLCFVISTISTAQKTINGITLPATIKKDNVELLLNGAGIRRKVFFKLYVAGLYVATKPKNAEEIIGSDKAEAMQLTITSGMISSGNMSEAIEEGFKKSMKGNTSSLQPKIDVFINTFKKEQIKEGNVFEIWYLPSAGVQTYKNRKLQSTITGLDFKKALFGIWFSAVPVDDDLKRGLLGL